MIRARTHLRRLVPQVAVLAPQLVALQVKKAQWIIYLKKMSVEGARMTCYTLITSTFLCRFFNISCAQNEAKFYLKRFARGSVGKCILFKERWLTPNEFQAISGRKSSKDWKRSIRLRGRCLKEFIAQGLFQEHVKTCICKICSGENVDMLKQEGEMALAVKRRRLSQADSLPASSEPASSVSQPPSTVPSDTNDGTKKGRGRGRGRKTPIKLDPEEKREHSPGPNKIWSPSGGIKNMT